MFKIIAAPNEPDDFGIFFNNKFIDEAYFDKKEKITQNEGLIQFELEKIRNISVTDFPDNFQFNFGTDKFYLEHFDTFHIKKIGKGIMLNVGCGLDLESFDECERFQQLIWNPILFLNTAKQIAVKKGIDAGELLPVLDGDLFYMNLTYYFPIKEKETLGNLFDIVFKETAAILHEAEMVLFNEAAKKLEKKKQQGKNY